MTDPTPPIQSDLDKIMFDIYNIGRTDVRLNCDDYTTLRPGIKKKLTTLITTKEREAEIRGLKTMQKLIDDIPGSTPITGGSHRIYLHNLVNKQIEALQTKEEK